MINRDDPIANLQPMALPAFAIAIPLMAIIMRLIRLHLLPNILAPLIVMTMVDLSSAILFEAALSLLGLGIQSPEPTWGGMLNSTRKFMERLPWLAIFPGVPIMLIVMGFNFLGDGLRDILDPRLQDR